MLLEQYLFSVVKYALNSRGSEQDVLSCMIFLHTHHTRCREEVVLDDNCGSRDTSPLTRHHCSAIVAKAVANPSLPSNPGYWYSRYDMLTPYEVYDDVDAQWKERVTFIIGVMKESLLLEAWPEYI